MQVKCIWKTVYICTNSPTESPFLEHHTLVFHAIAGHEPSSVSWSSDPYLVFAAKFTRKTLKLLVPLRGEQYLTSPKEYWPYQLTITFFEKPGVLDVLNCTIHSKEIMRKDNEMSNRNKDRQFFGKVLAKVATSHLKEVCGGMGDRDCSRQGKE